MPLFDRSRELSLVHVSRAEFQIQNARSMTLLQWRIQIPATGSNQTGTSCSYSIPRVLIDADLLNFAKQGPTWGEG
jgi:hypothetical protein